MSQDRSSKPSALDPVCGFAVVIFTRDRKEAEELACELQAAWRKIVIGKVQAGLRLMSPKMADDNNQRQDTRTEEDQICECKAGAKESAVQSRDSNEDTQSCDTQTKELESTSIVVWRSPQHEVVNGFPPSEKVAALEVESQLDVCGPDSLKFGLIGSGVVADIWVPLFLALLMCIFLVVAVLWAR